MPTCPQNISILKNTHIPQAYTWDFTLGLYNRRGEGVPVSKLPSCCRFCRKLPLCTVKAFLEITDFLLRQVVWSPNTVQNLLKSLFHRPKNCQIPYYCTPPPHNCFLKNSNSPSQYLFIFLESYSSELLSSF